METGHPFPLWRTLGFPPCWGTAPCARSAQWGAIIARLKKAMPPGVTPQDGVLALSMGVGPRHASPRAHHLGATMWRGLG